MKILADSNIPYLHEIFGYDNEINFFEGRLITAKSLKNIDVLVVRSITKINQNLLDNNKIKFVGTVTSGTDHVDEFFLKKNNIAFASAPGSNAIAVVEYVFAALLWLAQRDGFFLCDKTIGIVGAGNIGGLLNQRLCSLGVHTLLCDPLLEKKYPNKNWKSFEKLISESDIITFHTPLIYTGRYPTWHMVNLDVLDALNSNTIIINTCRGSVIDNNALLKILQYGKKLRVVLDVWESEPRLLLPLLSYVDIGTAHIAGYTIESKIRSVMQIYKEYCNYFDIIDSNIVNLGNCLPFINYGTQLKNLDEFSLNQLVKLVYDIYHDHVLLKQSAVKSGGFDKLRQSYINRREWSALCINVYKKNCKIDKILRKLGFNVFHIRIC